MLSLHGCRCSCETEPIEDWNKDVDPEEMEGWGEGDSADEKEEDDSAL